MNEKIKIWNLFDKSVDQKKLSNNITRSSIKYNYYNKLERYALLRGANWSKKKREQIMEERKKSLTCMLKLSAFFGKLSPLASAFHI